MSYALCAELPVPERVVLSNGLTVVYRHNPVGQTFGFAAAIRASAGCETERTAGVRALTLGMMTHRPAGEDGLTPSAHVAMTGAVVGTSVDTDAMRVTAVGLAENFGKCLPALRDIIFSAEFDWSALEVVRASLQHELSVTSEDEVAYAEMMARAYLFTGTGCAWPVAGTEQSLARLTPSRVRRLHEELVRPQNVVLSVSGPMEREEVMGLISREFGAILPGVPSLSVSIASPDRDSILLHRPWPSSNAVFLMMCRAPELGDVSSAATDVLCAILGGGEGSALWRRLRRDLALAYSVDCHRNATADCATIELLAICRASDTGQVYGALLDLITDAQKNPPDENDLERAKNWLRGRYIFSQQSNLDFAIRAGTAELLMPGVGATYGDSLLEAYESVTAQEVQEAALAWTSRAVWVQLNGLPPRQ